SRRAIPHGAQAHAWPTWYHDLPRVFLTAPPASAPVAFPLRPCEQPLYGGTLATSSIILIPPSTSSRGGHHQDRDLLTPRVRPPPLAVRLAEALPFRRA